MTGWSLLLACFAVALVTWTLAGVVRRALLRRKILDAPNERSSHVTPTPRGGGLALIPVTLVAWLLYSLWGGAAVAGLSFVLVGACVLAAMSWLDDLHNLPAAPRLIAHALAVALGLFGLGESGVVFQGLLPFWLDHIAAGLAWLWFINLFNFMDGIDGISGVETIGIGAGLALIGLMPVPGAGFVLPALLAAATLGFLIWNWPPAKLFLGDVGSVPLGYLLGWLLLSWAIQGQWAVALILPLYYLADATITLARRALRGAKVWQAHREHFYQRAVQGGVSHARVSLGVLLVNVLLIVCAAWAASGRPWIALAAAAVVVCGFLAVLSRWALRET